jgi:D-allulose-6-phosphate 3-epimerase
MKGLNTMYKFSASLMCMNFTELKSQIEILNNRADFLHVDIMDGKFVRNITLSPMIMEQINEIARIPMDAHLMVENPSDFINMVSDAGAEFITLHAETINKNAFRMINKIKEIGCKVGVALNPATPLEYIKHYINLLDKITIMTVDAGFAAQKFIPEMLDKVRQAKKWKEKFNYNYLIEVDGSCNEDTYGLLINAGAEVFVMGSTGLFGLNPDLKTAWKQMINNFKREVATCSEFPEFG